MTIVYNIYQAFDYCKLLPNYIIILYFARMIPLSWLYKCNYYLIYIYIIYCNKITFSDILTLLLATVDHQHF